MKKINYRLLVLMIILLVVAIRFFTFRPPVTQQENFTKLSIENSNDNQNSVKKRSLHSDRNFFANSEFAEFFRDVPCKDSYLINNYFSELKNNQGTRQETLRGFADKLLEEGHIDKALEIAELIGYKSIYLRMIGMYLKQDNFEKAYELANSAFNDTQIIKKRDYSNFQIKAMEIILGYLTKKGKFDDALEIAISLDEERFKEYSNSSKQELFRSSSSDHFFSESSLIGISNEMVDRGKLDDALNVLDIMEKNNYTWGSKVDLILKIFVKQEDIGICDKDLIFKALETIDSISIDSYYVKRFNYKNSDSHYYRFIPVINYKTIAAVALSKLGYITPSREIIFKILNEIDTVKYNTRLNTCMADMALILDKAGLKELSERTLEKRLDLLISTSSEQIEYLPADMIASGFYDWSEEIVDKYIDESKKPMAYFRCASELLKSNEDERSEQILQKALKFGYKSDGSNSPYSFYSNDPSHICWEYGNLLAEKKNDVLADKYYKTAIDLYKQINDCDEIKDDDKNGMVKDFLKSDRFEWAEQIANTINSDQVKDYAYIELSNYFFEHNQLEKSIQYIDLINNNREKFYLLKNIAESMLEEKDYTGLMKIFPELLEIANDYSDEIERNEFFYIISQLLLALPCEEQQKYIPQFITAYES